MNNIDDVSIENDETQIDLGTSYTVESYSDKEMDIDGFNLPEGIISDAKEITIEKDGKNQTVDSINDIENPIAKKVLQRLTTPTGDPKKYKAKVAPQLWKSIKLHLDTLSVNIVELISIFQMIYGVFFIKFFNRSYGEIKK